MPRGRAQLLGHPPSFHSCLRPVAHAPSCEAFYCSGTRGHDVRNRISASGEVPVKAQVVEAFLSRKEPR
jgi:hypothetical protein